MSGREEREKYIGLELNTIGIKYEEWEEFDGSYFQGNYESAYQMVGDIITRNSKMIEKYGTVKRYDEFANIISFVGKRGSGKTSAMLSFMNSLKEYDKSAVKRKCSEKGKHYIFEQEGLMFTCLDCIDGSLLEKSEDIFQVVLAQMYQKYQRMHDDQKLELGETGKYDYKTREMIKEFESLYRIARELESLSERQSVLGESYISSLQTLASSQAVRDKFQKLVREYLIMMSYCYMSYTADPEKHYLVIAIDDLDLNIQNGFSMLEKIHRYLMGANIIILLSIDMEQTLQVCMHNFYKVIPKVDKLLREGVEHIRRITVDYLRKVLPMNYRIYMPDAGNKITDYVIVKDGKRQERKSVLFGTLYKKTGVAFDSQGIKLHFYESNSLRILAHFMMSLDMIKDLPDEILYDTSKGKSDISVNYDKNFRFMYNDLISRMAIEKIIDDDDRKMFENITRQDVRRSMELFINYGSKLLRWDRKNRTNYDSRGIYLFGRKYEENISTSNESNYGNLVNIIYDLGKIDNGRHKSMVCCLMAYFSYEFTRIYMYEKRIKDVVQNQYGALSQLISGSLAGKWAEEMIPKIKYSQERDRSVSEGYYAKPEEILGEYQLHSKEFCNVGSMFEGIFFSETDLSVETIKRKIINIEILFLSLGSAKVTGRSQEVVWCVQIESKLTPNSEESRDVLRISVKDGHKETTAIQGQFNIFNFVESSMERFEELKQFECTLLEEIKRFYKGKITEDITSKGLLAGEYKRWMKKYNDRMALPIYWFDMMYNVLKRAWREVGQENPESIDMDELFEYIGSAYQNIAFQLEKQEEFYKDSLSRKTRFKDLKTRFEDCPYVAYFLETRAEEVADRKAFWKYVASRIIKKVTNE